METVLGIALVAVITLIVMLIRFVICRLSDKAVDAVRNARIRARNESAPPQTQRLADRYNPQPMQQGRPVSRW